MDRLIYLCIFQALLRVKAIQRLVRFNCKAILSMSFHCAMIPRAMGQAGDKQVTGAGGGELGQGQRLCPGNRLGQKGEISWPVTGISGTYPVNVILTPRWGHGSEKGQGKEEGEKCRPPAFLPIASLMANKG